MLLLTEIAVCISMSELEHTCQPESLGSQSYNVLPRVRLSGDWLAYRNVTVWKDGDGGWDAKC